MSGSTALSKAQVEQRAYLKLMLHTAKYPWAQVNGFLLGDERTGGSDNVRFAFSGFCFLPPMCLFRAMDWVHHIMISAIWPGACLFGLAASCTNLVGVPDQICTCVVGTGYLCRAITILIDIDGQTVRYSSGFRYSRIEI